jgi:hypothetical protein
MPFPLNLYLNIAMAVSVPITTAIAALAAATVSVVRKEFKRASLENISAYHFKVKCSKTILRLEELKENKTTIPIGAYKKINTAAPKAREKTFSIKEERFLK